MRRRARCRRIFPQLRALPRSCQGNENPGMHGCGGGVSPAGSHFSPGLRMLAQGSCVRTRLRREGECIMLFRLGQQGIDPRSADEVVFGQTTDGMGAVAHQTAVISDLKIGMVILAVGNPGQRVDECERLVIVLETEGAAD